MVTNRRKPKTATGVRERLNRDGTVSYQVRWQSRDGRTQSATRDTFDEAVEFRQERLREIRLGGSGDLTGGRMLLGTWFDEVFLPAKGSTGRESTDATRRSYYRNHIAPTWSRHRLVDITEGDIERWLLDKRDELSVASIRKVYGYFAQALRRAHKKGLILNDPTGGIDLNELGFRLKDVDVRFLDPVEVVSLERSMDPHWSLEVPFLADSGLRIGEAAVVRVRALNLLRGSVSVEATLSKTRTGALVEGPPKTKAGRRVVPTLGPDLCDRIAAHIRERNLGPDDYLFAGERGGRMNPDNWRSRIFNPAAKQSGLGDPLPTPHALRHTAVSLWIASGQCKSETMVAQYAGHKQLASVYQLYGHLFETSAEELRERMQAFRLAAHLELEGRADEVVEKDRLRRPGRPT
jgi:integrase